MFTITYMTATAVVTSPSTGWGTTTPAGAAIMCKNTINVCVVCVETIQWTIPCEKKIEDSSATTLFIPTSCINQQTYTFTYHPDCANAYGDVSRGSLADELVKMCDDIIGPVLEGTTMCACKYVRISPSGSTVWHPEEFELKVPQRSMRVDTDKTIYKWMTKVPTDNDALPQD